MVAPRATDSAVDADTFSCSRTSLSASTSALLGRRRTERRARTTAATDATPRQNGITVPVAEWAVLIGTALRDVEGARRPSLR